MNFVVINFEMNVFLSPNYVIRNLTVWMRRMKDFAVKLNVLPLRKYSERLNREIKSQYSVDKVLIQQNIHVFR